MKQEWRVQAKPADFKKIGERYGFDQVIARIIRNRGMVTEADFDEYVYLSKDNLHSPSLMKDMDKAVLLISDAIRNKEKIRIVGDYDVDGINSIYIIYSGLIRLGADVDYVVPHRVTDGYGINERLIKEAFDSGCNLIVTCDNGIAAYDQISYAKELGMKVVVTDHHDIPFVVDSEPKEYILPPADAVVDPKQADCGYPFDKICGAVVGFKLIQALFEHYGRDKDEVFDFIEFAAIATVGDVMELKGENRTIVRLGLEKIKRTGNIGLNALINVCGLNKDNISSYHIGFVIGPCLNASGRLNTALQAITLLLCDDKARAERMAGELKDLNEERKTITLQGVKCAIDMIDNSELKDDMVLVVYLPDCHESIVGIIAGKIRERYNKPVIVFAEGEGCLKGSGRSTEHYNMFDKLSEAKHFLEKFGGHPMAAGMSIKKEKLDEFRRFLNDHCGMTEDDLVLRIWIDVPMPFEYVNETIIGQLKVLEPFGNANEKPVFADSRLIVRSLKHIGKEGNFTKLTLEKESGAVFDAIMFKTDETLEKAYAERRMVSVLYYPCINEFRGNSNIQMTITGVMLSK